MAPMEELEEKLDMAVTTTLENLKLLTGNIYQRN